MAAKAKDKPAIGRTAPRWPDFHRTGPDTLAGRYMRRFWHPVFHTADLPLGRAKPIRIMNVDYALYRGEDGLPHLLDARCPHRGMQLSAGWVEGSAVRCFYHGWKYDASGQCVEQPAEPRPFSNKVRIRSYPCEDYLGFVFAYLGEGDPPPLPRYPAFEKVEGVVEWDSYFRPCNFFNNAENSVDFVHSGFVHRNNPGSFDGAAHSPMMEGKESCWGITLRASWPDQVRVSQVGMPNIFHHKAQPTDYALAPYREFLAWWVPIDDESHFQFTVAAVRMPPDQAEQYVERRDARLAKRTHRHEDLVEQVLKGELYLDDIEWDSTDMLRLQDDIAQVGQGRIANHRDELLGQSDRAMILLRRIWAREMGALAEGRALKRWIYDPEALAISRGELWERQYQSGLAGAPASRDPG